jgi:hypothetical protein
MSLRLSIFLTTVDPNGITLDACIVQSSGSAVLSFKLFGFAVLKKAGRNDTGGQAIGPFQTGTLLTDSERWKDFL